MVIGIIEVECGMENLVVLVIMSVVYIIVYVELVIDLWIFGFFVFLVIYWFYCLFY